MAAQLRRSEPDQFSIQWNFTKVSETYERLKVIDREVLQLILEEEVSEEEYTKEEERMEEYDDEWYQIRILMDMKKQRSGSDSPTNFSTTASGTTSLKKSTYKLPKIELKKFNGEVTEWLSFWAQFKKIDEDGDLHSSDKFQYLVQSMVQNTRAYDVVSTYNQTAENYPKVIQALKDRFRRPKILKRVYVRELIGLVIKNSNSKVKVTEIYDKLESHLHSLESLGITSDQMDVILFPLVESCLRVPILTAWQRSGNYGRDGSGEDPPRTEFNFLMDFIRLEVEGEQQRSLAQTSFGVLEAKSDKKKDNNEGIPTAAGLLAGQTPSCIFCDKSHDSEKCYKAQVMTLSEKKLKVLEKKACHSCLRPGHRAKDCKISLKCIVCSKRHTPIVCPDLPSHKGEKKTESKERAVAVTHTNLNCTSVALKRLESTTSKLLSTGNYEKYCQLFKEWEEEGFIEKVDEETLMVKSGYFLPHRAVYKPKSKTTPIRPVFDASCKTGRAPSLNECLEKGPNLIELIPSILNRFREGRIGVISDIRKAYQMIGIKEEDRDFLRFLWWKNFDQKIVKVFRHKRVVFGLTCSPFLLGAVIDFHLSQVADERKITAEKLKKSIYVDNCVTSFESMEDYEMFKRHAITIMENANMELRCWECGTGTMSRVGLSTSERCGLDIGVIHTPDKEITNVLGLHWDKAEDTLSISVDLVGEFGSMTKRKILSYAHKLYDPIGFTCPVLLCPKMVLQQFWKNDLSWDEELQEEDLGNFYDWCKEIPKLSEVKIPRMITGGVSSRRNWEFHVFSDASQLAYAAVVFLRTVDENGFVSVQLVQAKSRVSPMKKITIPRLELLGCNIAARLSRSVMKSLNSEEIPIWFWSDSTTALAWIRRNDNWGTFVGNRVREIISLSHSEQWRYVPGMLNPADLPSRGCTVQELIESRWWEGPTWLKEPKSQWPSQKPVPTEEDVDSEKKKVAVTMMSLPSATPWYIIKGSYLFNIRVVSWVQRFVNKCRNIVSERGTLTVKELEVAEEKVLGFAQKESFPSDCTAVSGLRVKIDSTSGLIRVQTRLLHKEDTIGFREPILLPHSHPLVDEVTDFGYSPKE